MRVWAVGLVAVLVAGAATGGYLLRPSEEREVVSYDGPSPVAAVSPSFPAEPPDVRPDPTFPALETGVGLRPIRIGDKPFDLKLQVPVGWVQTIPQASEWKFFPPPGDVLNTYFLRVRLVGNQYQPVATILEARINALDGAESVKDFVVESRTADGFVANYVNDGYRCVEMNRWVPSPDGGPAFAWIGLVGREVDREAMTDLLARIVDSARPGPDYE